MKREPPVNIQWFFGGKNHLIGVAFPVGSVGAFAVSLMSHVKEAEHSSPQTVTISLEDGWKVAQTQSDQRAIDRIFVSFFKATAVIWWKVEEAAHCAVGTPVSRSMRTPLSAVVSPIDWPHKTNSLDTFKLSSQLHKSINNTQPHFNELNF